MLDLQNADECTGIYRLSSETSNGRVLYRKIEYDENNNEIPDNEVETPLFLYYDGDEYCVGEDPLLPCSTNVLRSET